MKEEDVDMKKNSDYSRKRLWATAERWTRLKEELSAPSPPAVQSQAQESKTPESSSVVAVAG